MAEISVFPIEVFENTCHRNGGYDDSRGKWSSEKRGKRKEKEAISPARLPVNLLGSLLHRESREEKTVPLINHLHLLLVFVAEWRPSSVSFRCKRIVKVQARRREESSIVFESTRMISHGCFPPAKTIENINHGSKSIGRLYRRVYEAGHSFRA